MAKRSSEHQLTRDDDSEGEEEAQVGMVKADPSVLASRPIRGLPKRKGATPLSTSAASSNSSSAAPSPRLATFTGFGTTPAPAETKSEAPRFTGFGGFGTTSAVSSTVTPAAISKPSEAPRFAGFTGFGAAPPTTTTKSDVPTESKPAEAPRFAAFTGFGSLKPATSSTSTPSAPVPKPEAPKPATESKSDTTAALTYWTSLRGLNHAFVESAKKAVEADMFCDLGMAFKQYKEFREKVVKDYEDAKRASGVIADVVKSVETAKPAEAKPSFGFGTAAGASSKDSPFSFGSSKPSAPPASTSAPTSKPSPFSLNLPSAKPTAFGSMDPSLVTPAPTPPVQPPSPRKPVATFNATESALPEATPTPSPMPDGHAPNMFDIAAAKSDAPTPNPIVPEGKEKVPSVFETTAAKAASTAPTTKPAFTFGSSTTTFGSTTSTKPDVKPFSFSTSNSAGFSGFGNSSGAPTPALSTTATAGSSVPPSTKPFSFTTPLSTPGTPFAFGAGSPKGNTTPRPGGSVGFSFGNSPPRKDAPGFPFGASVSAAVTPKSEKGPSDEEKEQTKEGESEKPAGEGEVADGEEVDRAQTAGAGEENEDTLYSSRARVLRFNKTAWVGVGIGQFKIKYDRETKKRRILHRLEGTGRVVVNCGLFDDMNPVLESKGLMRFTGADEQGHPMLYRVKVKTEADAETLTHAFKDALEAHKADKAA